MPEASILDIHREIAEIACDHPQYGANVDPWVIQTFGGPVFKPGELRYSLQLVWPEVKLRYDDNQVPPEVVTRLHQIGKKAIHNAIWLNRERFVGLIVGLARKSENYFDLFER